MRDISTILIMLLCSWVCAVQLSHLRWGTKLALGLPASLASIILLFWRIEVPMDRNVHFVLGLGSSLGLIAISLMLFRRSMRHTHMGSPPAA
jgi:cell shape-determining protein MreD